MYKLLLSLRYLLRRRIAVLAVLVVFVCVAMVLIVSSVFNGFLMKIESAAQGLLGEIIVDPPPGGTPYYQEFIDLVEAENPEIVAGTPVVYSSGILRYGGFNQDYTHVVQIAGIRMPEAAGVTSFGRGLRPAGPGLPEPHGFTPPQAMLQRFGEDAELARIRLHEDSHPGMGLPDGGLLVRLQRARQQIDAEYGREEPDEQRLTLLNSQVEALERLISMERQTIQRVDYPGVILGVDLAGMTRRDPDTGEYEYFLPSGATLQITMLPLGRGRVQGAFEAVTPSFTHVGWSRQDLHQIDSTFVYADFETIQRYNEMDARTDTVTGEVSPARCSQILFHAEGVDGEDDLQALAQRIAAQYRSFADEYEGASNPDYVQVRTWREKQRPFIDPFEKQRTLAIIMFAIISIAAVAVIFAIFYMLVFQKTKDIGILKSLGASNAGVAGIWLLYGAVISLIGSVAGVVVGWLFVMRINEIHDWIAKTFDWRVYNRESYQFDRIPSYVDPAWAAWIVIGFILAGLLGALVPALAAARMKPVEALSYE